MNAKFSTHLIFILAIVFCNSQLSAQTVQPKDSVHYITLKASEKYYKSGLYRFFLGQPLPQ